MTNPGNNNNNNLGFGRLLAGGALSGAVNNNFDAIIDRAIDINIRNGVSAQATPATPDLIRSMAPQVAQEVLDNLDRLLKNRKALETSGASAADIQNINNQIGQLIPAINELRAYGREQIRANPHDNANIDYNMNIVNLAERAAANIVRADRTSVGPGGAPVPSGANGLSIEQIRNLGAQGNLYRAGRQNKLPGSQTGALDRAGLEDARKQIKLGLEAALRDPTLNTSQKEDYIQAANSADGKIKRALEGQKRDIEEKFNQISRLIAATAILQTASKVMLSDPFTYGTMPALRMMGKTGEMGQAVSSAMIAKEQYNMERNQTAVGLGGALMAGGGIGGKLLGAGLAGFGLTGQADDVWNKVAGKFGMINDKEVYQRSLAENVFKPDRVSDLAKLNQQATIGISDFSTRDGASKGGLYYGNLDDKHNMLKTDNKSQSGIVMADRLLEIKNSKGYGLSRAGYSSTDILKMVADFSGKTSVMDEASMKRAIFSGAMTAPGRATTAEQMLDNFANIRKMGINDMGKTISINNQIMGAVSDEDGKLNAFASNVLAPALIQVSQSLQLKNMSTSAEKMTQQVGMMYADITKGAGKGTSYADIMSKHPELLGRAMESQGEAMKGMMYTPQGMALLRNAGIDMDKLATGEIDVVEASKQMGKFIAKEGQYGFNLDKSDFNEKGQLRGEDGARFARLLGMFEKMGLDKNYLQYAAYKEVTGKKDLTIEQFEKDADLMRDTSAEKSHEFYSESASKLREAIAQQTDALNKISSEMTPKIIRAQEVMKEYISNGTLSADAEKGINEIIRELKLKLGMNPDDGKDGTTKGDDKTTADKPRKDAVSTSQSAPAEAAKAAANTTTFSASTRIIEGLGLGHDPKRSIVQSRDNARAAVTSFEKVDKKTGTSLAADFEAARTGAYKGDISALIDRYVKNNPELKKQYEDFKKSYPPYLRQQANMYYVNQVIKAQEGLKAGLGSAEQAINTTTISKTLPKPDANNSSANNQVPIPLSAAGREEQIARVPAYAATSPGGMTTYKETFKDEKAVTTAVDRAMATLKPEIREKLQKMTPDRSIYAQTRGAIDKELKNPKLTDDDRKSLLNRRNLLTQMEKQDAAFERKGDTKTALNMRRVLKAGNLNGGADGIFDTGALFTGPDGRLYNGVGGTTPVDPKKVGQVYANPKASVTSIPKGKAKAPTTPTTTTVSPSTPRVPASAKANVPKVPAKGATIPKPVTKPATVPNVPKVPKSKTGAVSTPTTTTKPLSIPKGLATPPKAGITPPRPNVVSTAAAQAKQAAKEKEQIKKDNTTSTNVEQAGPYDYIVRISNNLPPEEMRREVNALTKSNAIASRGGSPQALGLHI